MSSHGIFLILSLLWITVAVAVGIHASSRNRSGFVWGLVTFLLGIFGVVVYLLALLLTDDPSGGEVGDGDDTERVRRCPDCSTRHDGEPNYCSNCGEPLDEDDDVVIARLLRSGSRGYCSNCKSQVDLDADDCSNCGAIL